MPVLKPYFDRYFYSWWMPTAAALPSLGILLLFQSYRLYLGPNIGLYLFAFILALIFLYVLFSGLTAATFQFASRAWLSGLVSLSLCLALTTITLPALHIIGFMQKSGESRYRERTLDSDVAYVLPRMPSEQGMGHSPNVYGLPEIYAVNGHSGGVYAIHAYVNPGERGHLYLKVYDTTSDRRIKIRGETRRWDGWSGDSGKLFLYLSEVRLHNGGWDSYYPARFELWFVPTSGAEERKLVENVVLVKGWNRQ